jgi:hypothetical protein
VVARRKPTPQSLTINPQVTESSSIGQGSSLSSGRRVIGCNKSSSAKFTSSTQDKWHIFVGRLNKDTTVSDIKEYLESNNISVNDIKKTRGTTNVAREELCISIMCKPSI